MAGVPNRGGPFRAIGAKIKTARAAKQGRAASENYKASMAQSGHNVGAWGPGQNADWSTNAAQKQHEQHSQQFMDW